MSMLLAAAAALSMPLACPKAIATDGDTVKFADGVRIRMSGIDTPEMPGHCRRGRDCAPGDPHEAKRRLQVMLDVGAVTYSPIKRDLYGRTVAVVWSGNINLNCYQLDVARYKPDWDTGKFVAKLCGVK